MDASELRILLLVALGGALGSVARFGLSGVLNRAAFPWGTLVVNFSGTFLATLIFFAVAGSGGLSAESRSFLLVGVLGGYTTFSTFGVETVEMLRTGSVGLALTNVALNLGLCLGGGVAGAVFGSALGAA